MSDTAHLKLPYLAAAQAQKHVTHNEALTLLDALVQAAVTSRAVATPPATPSEGDRYLVPASPTGSWAGQTGKLACFLNGAWSFLDPQEGWLVWVDDENRTLAFDGSTWISPPGPDVLQNLSLLGVNATADASNKFSVASAATLFNHAGSGHQIKLNKNAASDTASILYQTAWSGRAEFGTTGDDDFHIKVSSDGSSFAEALTIPATSAVVVARKSLRLEPQTGDPSSPQDGQLWYNATSHVFRKRENGVTSDLSSTGSLDDLADVVLTSPGTGQVLRFNGTNWVNQAVGTGVADGDYGDVVVSGTGTVIAVESIAGNLDLKGIISPVQITAQQNDYAPSGLAAATVLRLSSDNDSRAITGLAAQNSGSLRVIENVGSTDLLLYHEHTSSSAANRFDTGGPAVVIAKGGVAVLKYDGTTSRWRVLGVQGAGQSRAGNRRQTTFFADFLAAGTTMNPPFTGTAVSSGTSAMNAATYNDRPGMVNLTSSTSANSGFRWQTDANSIRVSGGEVFECVFFVNSLTNTLTRMGFHDSTSSADAVDGAYIELPAGSGAAVLKTASNSTRTSSGTIATLTTANWYRAVITVNRDATAVTAEIYDSSGGLLGSQTNTANIPSAVGRECQVGIIHTNSGATATTGIILDYLAFRNGDGKPALR
jgi:hypothetical protein